MGIIKLNNMEFYSYHGCFAEETKVGNYFIVDLEVKADTQIPEESDDINDAVSYLTMYQLVDKQMAIASKLLEHVAKRILDALYEAYPDDIQHAQVTLHKMNPPLGGKVGSSSVTLDR